MLKGKSVVILGGSSGIGFAVAEAAAAKGADVHIGSSNAEKVSAAVARLGGSASGAAVDLTDAASVERFFALMGTIDHLVYTAGDWVRRKTSMGTGFDIDAARASFDTRFWGALLALDHALPHLADDASVTLTSGVLAHRPSKGQAMATALAGAVEHLVRGLSVDLAPRRVNVVTAGLIATDVWSRLPPETIDAMVAGQPIERIGRPEEVAEAFLYFMRAGFTTGQVAVVDGGRLFA